MKKNGGTKLATLMVFVIIIGVVGGIGWFAYLAMFGPRM